jgi:hypothetical protein
MELPLAVLCKRSPGAQVEHRHGPFFSAADARREAGRLFASCLLFVWGHLWLTLSTRIGLLATRRVRFVMRLHSVPIRLCASGPASKNGQERCERLCARDGALKVLDHMLEHGEAAEAQGALKPSRIASRIAWRTVTSAAA